MPRQGLKMPPNLLQAKPLRAETQAERMARREALLRYSGAFADVIAERLEYPKSPNKGPTRNNKTMRMHMRRFTRLTDG